MLEFNDGQAIMELYQSIFVNLFYFTFPKNRLRILMLEFHDGQAI